MTCRSRPDVRPRITLTSERHMDIRIPDFCLVLLIGISGSGKTTFARRVFDDSEIITSDWTGIGAGPGDQGRDASEQAFEALSDVVSQRLRQRLLTVVDAAHVTGKDRVAMVRFAKEHFAKTVAIAFDPDRSECHRNNAGRIGHRLTEEEVDQQFELLRRGINGLGGEGFAAAYHLRTREEMDGAVIVREPLACDQRHERGPFDIIGDVHGCRDELVALLEALGYSVNFRGKGKKRSVCVKSPVGRRVIFVGDLVDRGPASPDVLRIVMSMVDARQALCVLGNHDSRFMRWLQGRNVSLIHGLDTTVAQFRNEPMEFRAPVQAFLENLHYQLWLDDGALVVAHAGVRADMIGRTGGAVREFCLYGDRSGGKDAAGLPVRYHWALDYDGDPAVVYGHTPVPEAVWVNNTLCVDTGCSFGGQLTALRWPEREIVSVPAVKVHSKRVRAFGHPPPRPVAANGEQNGSGSK